MTYKNLIEIIEKSPTYFDFIVDDTTIFTSDTFITECETNYFDLSIFYYKDNMTDIQVLNYFKKCFDNWKLEIGANAIKFFKGLEIEYNPTENYNRVESGKVIDELHKGTKTSSATDTTITPSEKNKISSFVVGDDNETALLDGYTEREILSGNTKTVGEIDKNYTLIEDISNDKFDKNVHTFEEYNIHGNIGVSTSASILTEEKTLRLTNYVEEIIHDFITKHTIYIESEY